MHREDHIQTRPDDDVYKPRGEALRRNQPRCLLDPALPASRTQGDKFLQFKPPSVCNFVQQPSQTNKGRFPERKIVVSKGPGMPKWVHLEVVIDE